MPVELSKPSFCVAPEPKIYPVRILSSDGVPESSGEVRPLPNETLVEKNKNEWVIQYVKVTSYLNTSVNAPKFVSFTFSIGKDDRVIGTDTMTYLTARFNAFSLGLQYSKDAMSPWNFLKKKQSARFVELFKNMTMQDKNIRYELQNMYNTIVDNVMDVDSKTGEKVENDKSRKCTQTFADFLKACKIIASETDGKAQKQAFQDASKLLDDIFRMNFEYNFMFDYNKAYKIDVR